MRAAAYCVTIRATGPTVCRSRHWERIPHPAQRCIWDSRQFPPRRRLRFGCSLPVRETARRSAQELSRNRPRKRRPASLRRLAGLVTEPPQRAPPATLRRCRSRRIIPRAWYGKSLREQAGSRLRRLPCPRVRRLGRWLTTRDPSRLTARSKSTYPYPSRRPLLEELRLR